MSKTLEQINKFLDDKDNKKYHFNSFNEEEYKISKAIWSPSRYLSISSLSSKFIYGFVTIYLSLRFKLLLCDRIIKKNNMQLI